MAPRRHVTVPVACEQVPCEGVADVYDTVVGRVSVTVTLLASEGPLLVTVSVYVRVFPCFTGFGAPVLVIAISELETMVVVSDAESLVTFSSFPPEAVAVLVRVPPAV